MKKLTLLKRRLTCFIIFIISFVQLIHLPVFATEITDSPTFELEPDTEETVFEPISPLDLHTEHTFGEWITYSSTQHMHSCECGQIEYANHTWIEVESIASTHTSQGYRIYICEECNDTKTEVIASLPEHIYDYWHNYNSIYHVRTCECGHSEYEPHEFGPWITLQEPTTETEGYARRSCIICSLFQNQVIEKLTVESTATTQETEEITTEATTTGTVTQESSSEIEPTMTESTTESTSFEESEESSTDNRKETDTVEETETTTIESSTEAESSEEIETTEQSTIDIEATMEEALSSTECVESSSEHKITNLTIPTFTTPFFNTDIIASILWIVLIAGVLTVVIVLIRKYHKK